MRISEGFGVRCGRGLLPGAGRCGQQPLDEVNELVRIVLIMSARTKLKNLEPREFLQLGRQLLGPER